MGRSRALSGAGIENSCAHFESYSCVTRGFHGHAEKVLEAVIFHVSNCFY